MTCRQCTADISTLQYAEASGCGLCAACFGRPFKITSVCRADLLEYVKKSDIGNLDDADMEYLAGKMADAYMNVFWDDLSILLDAVLKAKKRT